MLGVVRAAGAETRRRTARRHRRSAPWQPGQHVPRANSESFRAFVMLGRDLQNSPCNLVSPRLADLDALALIARRHNPDGAAQVFRRSKGWSLIGRSAAPILPCGPFSISSWRPFPRLEVRPRLVP